MVSAVDVPSVAVALFNNKQVIYIKIMSVQLSTYSLLIVTFIYRMLHHNQKAMCLSPTEFQRGGNACDTTGGTYVTMITYVLSPTNASYADQQVDPTDRATLCLRDHQRCPSRATVLSWVGLGGGGAWRISPSGPRASPGLEVQLVQGRSGPPRHMSVPF